MIVKSGHRFVKEHPVVRPHSRREFLELTLAGPAGLAAVAATAAELGERPVDVHEQLLELAARQEKARRARFAAVTSRDDLISLQSSLRDTFLRLIDGLPAKSAVPAARKTGTIEADDYIVEKLVFESFPGYFVSALLYKPKRIVAPLPGVLSPGGHSTTGKAAGPYQILHINLAERGYVVLTYDPVGQGERSQFWDAKKGRLRFNLSCGEHAVLGNPLYLLGTSLARYRIWDGMRGLDYLISLPEVDASKIGCVGNSGGGTLTAYIAALDPRVSVAAIGCYITTLRRRMGNRIQQDPDADPEQDIFGFVSEGIDHVGLNLSTKPSDSMRSPAWATVSNAWRPPRSTVSPPRSAWLCTSGSDAGCPEGRKRPRSRNCPPHLGPRSNCSFARKARSISRTDPEHCCRWLWRNLKARSCRTRSPFGSYSVLIPI
jgi:dienelactone hydrolase